MNISKEDLIKEFVRLNKKYKEANPKGSVTRDFFRKNSKYNDASWSGIWGSFRIFKDEATKSTFSRESIDISQDDSCNTTKRRYFVTAAISNAELDRDFFDSVVTYCKTTNTKLVILPMRGVKSSDSGYTEELIEYADYFATDYIFNSNLVAKDFLISPQVINPLTGLDRFGQKSYSLIIASPKQFMNVVPVSHESIAHTMHSTGSITIPTYATTKQGKLAEQDHCRGGLIVEIENNTIFHIRQIQCDNSGGFNDLGNYYSKNKVEPKRASAIVLGDMHMGFEDETACTAWHECIEATNPKFIIMHDIFDAHSISHHHMNDIERQVNRKVEIDTLEKELNHIGTTLKAWSDKFPDKEIVIVRSNHDEFLDRYLKECRYRNDRVNHKLSLKLAYWLIEGNNPLEEYITRNFNLKNIVWLKREKDYKIHDIMISSHGDKRANSFWSGNIASAEKAYGNAIIGHSHTPQIFRNIWQVGTSTSLMLDYNKGAPSSWLHTSCLLYKNQQRQFITAIDGHWHI